MMYVIGCTDELVYVETNGVMKALSPADTTVSLDLDFVDSGNTNRIVLKGLKQDPSRGVRRRHELKTVRGRRTGHHTCAYSRVCAADHFSFTDFAYLSTAF